MIISKTAYRLSFFGGGSDYPAWFCKHEGAVLSTTINKYAYISARYLPSFHEHKYRAVWSRIENVSSIEEITHPAIREILKFLDIQEGVVINHDGDLPAASGMGSSSSFIVGLLNALHHLKGEKVDKTMLAREAIYVEQTLVKNVVGNQDQVAAAFGGLNVITFHDTETCRPDPVGFCGFQVRKLEIPDSRRKELESYLMLAFTGFSHNAPEIAKTYKLDAGLMYEMQQMAFEGESRLYIGTMREFGRMLDYSWELKKRMSPHITTQYVDFLYEKAIASGAIGGKLLGAGGGGFLLLFCEPDKQQCVKEALKGMLFVPFEFENKGSSIIANGVE